MSVLPKNTTKWPQMLLDLESSAQYHKATVPLIVINYTVCLGLKCPLWSFCTGFYLSGHNYTPTLYMYMQVEWGTMRIIALPKNLRQWPQSSSQRLWPFWLPPRMSQESRTLGEIQRRGSISRSAYSLYMYSETVIELKCMCTIKLKPGFFWFWFVILSKTLSV